MGIKEVLSAQRSPWQRAYIERLIGTIRRECLDHVSCSANAAFTIICTHSLGITTKLALQKDSPEPRGVQTPDAGRVISIPEVGGLHHRYERRAA